MILTERTIQRSSHLGHNGNDKMSIHEQKPPRSLNSSCKQPATSSPGLGWGQCGPRPGSGEQHSPPSFLQMLNGAKYHPVQIRNCPRRGVASLPKIPNSVPTLQPLLEAGGGGCVPPQSCLMLGSSYRALLTFFPALLRLVPTDLINCSINS